MSYIGIRCTYSDFDLRRDLMLFDQLALPHLESSLRMWTRPDADDEMRQWAAELEWLANKEIVFIPDATSLADGPASDYYQEYLRKESETKRTLEQLRSYVISRGFITRTREEMAHALAEYARDTGDVSVLDRLDAENRFAYDDLARALAVDMSERLNVSVIPIMSSKSHDEGLEGFARGNVLNIALSAVPFPSSSTSLENLLEFRSDPTVRADFLAFHRWARNAATNSQRPNEIAEEIEYLLSQYKRHMEIHRLEQSSSVFETVTTVAAEALEDLVKFKWGDAAKLLFAFRKRRVGLLKAEMSAPGRELAYLVKASSIS